MNLNKLLDLAIEAAKTASVEILKIYHSEDFGTALKADQSPLTLADQASHKAIEAYLRETGIPVLSEDGAQTDYAIRKNWDYFWLIDPLDGTKEFVKRNGEFTVNIALIQKGTPILGVVQTPVTQDLYFAVLGSGAYKNGEPIEAAKFDISDAKLNVVASRSHLNPETQLFLDQLKNPQIVSKGSSLKLLMVAEGTAHLYPRFAPTMEWDTAAAQIIVTEAGGKILIKDTDQSIVYNKENLLNPYFLVLGKQD